MTATKEGFLVTSTVNKTCKTLTNECSKQDLTSDNPKMDAQASSNQAEIASIGEEMDENFLFNDTDSLNRSVTSLASLASSADSNKRPGSGERTASAKQTRGFSISRLWGSKQKKHQQNQPEHSCPCPECNHGHIPTASSANSTKLLSTTVATVPKIKCHIISEPVTPVGGHGGVASSWTYGYQIPLKHNNRYGIAIHVERDFAPTHF